MKNRAVRVYFRLLTIGLVLGGTGCGLLLGLDEFEDAPAGSPGSGGGGGTSSSGSDACERGKSVPCYEGPAATEDVGICKAGAQMCNAEGTAYGQCQGQVTPTTETCASPDDEDCDGHDCVLWAALFGDVNDQRIDGAATDPEDNTIITGTFYGTIAFDPTHPISGNNHSGYLAKFDTQGNSLWSSHFENVDGIHGIAVDKEGNSNIVGTFRNSITLGGTTHTSSNSYMAFVAKFGPDGDILWSKMFADADITMAEAIAVDSHGNIVITGTAGCDLCTDQKYYPWFIKYNQEGTQLITKRLPSGVDTPMPTAVTTDPFDNIIITGTFTQSYYFDGRAIENHGGTDVFVIKYDSTGSLVWANSYGDAADQWATSIACDNLGQAVVLGAFTGSIDFKGETQLLSAVGAKDIYLAKLSSAGGGVWSTSFKGEGWGRGVAMEDNGAIVFTGSMSNQMDFGTKIETSHGGADILVVKTDENGKFLWSRVFGNEEGQSGNVIAPKRSGDVWFGAFISGALEIGNAKLSSVGGTDILLTKLAP